MFRATIVGLALALVLSAAPCASAKPLTEKGLAAMAEAGFDDAEILAKLKKDGIDFPVDDEAIARLKKAGLSDSVLDAVAAAKKSNPAAAPPITYDSVLKLLENGVDEATIVLKLTKSPSVFTLSREQEKALRDAGATNVLISAMKGSRPAEATPEPISDLAIVLDVSGSMKETTPDGASKIEVAKEVVGELISKIPAGLNVSFTVYGHRAGCSAVQNLRPLAEFKDADRAELTKAVKELQPVGNTPIALALRRVGEQFAGRKSYCGIVLITDGLESCKGDPAAEAAKLAENEFLRFGVNVVGLGLKDEENAATEKIATSGKGKFYAASDRAELLTAIEDVTKKLKTGAKPAPISDQARKGRRAILVKKPEVDYPAMKELHLVKPKAVYYTVESYSLNKEAAYDKEIRQASADPVDLWWVPKEGLPIRLVIEIKNPERQVKELRMEDLVGMVRVTSDVDNKDAVVALTDEKNKGAGTVETYQIQRVTGFNKDMVVPPGKYNVWVRESKDENYQMIEEGLEVTAAEVSTVER